MSRIARTGCLVLFAAVAIGACTKPSTTTESPGRPEATVRTDLVTLRGTPLTLEGAGVNIGQPAPDVVLVANDMTEKRLSDFRGQTVILATVPSIDTAVCDLETRTFNERAAALPGDVVVLTVSMDLPFAQTRWCAAHGIDRVVTLSDYKHRDLGEHFGVRIRESGLLARTVTVIDPNGIVRYQEIVPELTAEPDYEAALRSAQSSLDSVPGGA